MSLLLYFSSALLALGGVFSLLGAVPVAVWLCMTGWPTVGMESVVPLVFNELLYVVCMWIYLAVLKREEPSRVIPFFQAIPVFGVVGAAFVLAEFPKPAEFLAIGMLVAGGFLLSFHKGKIGKRMATLMVLASAIIAGYDVIFAEFGRDVRPAAAILIGMIAKAFWLLLILAGKKERRGFRLALRTRFKLQSVSEVASIAADSARCYFLLVFPVAMVQTICCTQPLFVLATAVILTRIHPAAIREEVQRLTLVQKACGIALMVAGGVLLARS